MVNQIIKFYDGVSGQWRGIPSLLGTTVHQSPSPPPPPPPTIVSWTDGTDEQIAAMVARAYAGEIVLSDYWSVGDTRFVHLSAMAGTDSSGVAYETHAEQDVEFVIMDFTCTGFTIEQGKSPLMIVGMKDSLAEPGNINTTGTNNGGWQDCRRREWCNGLFANALPSTFKQIFKQFTWKTGIGNKAQSGLNSTTDIFALPTEKVIFGRCIYAQNDEADSYDQWDWYQTEANRIKKEGMTGSASGWWGSSPYSGRSGYFGIADVGGRAHSANAFTDIGLAPFGCI